VNCEDDFPLQEFVWADSNQRISGFLMFLLFSQLSLDNFLEPMTVDHLNEKLRNFIRNLAFGSTCQFVFESGINSVFNPQYIILQPT